MRRTDGELILLWTLPALAILWHAVFLLFPGFVQPMSPTMSAQQVAAFYRDPENLPRIRTSMIVFNWFAVGLIPLLALIVMQIRRMAHRTPIFSYSIIACAAGGPTIFLMANLFWLVAAFRPERDPELTLLLNDLAWVTFASQVGFLIAQSVLLALAIYLDRQARPVFGRWVAHFNLLVAAAMVPASFVGLAMEGPIAWDGLLTFWLRNIASWNWSRLLSTALRSKRTRPKCRRNRISSAPSWRRRRPECSPAVTPSTRSRENRSRIMRHVMVRKTHPTLILEKAGS